MSIVRIENVPILYLDGHNGWGLEISPTVMFHIPPYVPVRTRQGVGVPDVGLAKVRNTGKWLAADIVLYDKLVPSFPNLIPYYCGEMKGRDSEGRITELDIQEIDLAQPGSYYASDTRLAPFSNYEWLYIDGEAA